jgi:hypothetical protein
MTGTIILTIIQMLGSWLSNEEFQHFVIGKFQKDEKDPTNAINPEYTEGIAKSMSERFNNKIPADGNVFLEQAEIDSLKKAHRNDPSTNQHHEQV